MRKTTALAVAAAPAAAFLAAAVAVYFQSRRIRRLRARNRELQAMVLRLEDEVSDAESRVAMSYAERQEPA